MWTLTLRRIAILSAMLLTATTADAQPTFTPIQINNEFVEVVRSVYAADLDGDGDKDVLAAQWNTITWYENDGGLFPTFTSHEIFFGGSFLTSATAMDVDSDGDLDVISARGSDGLIQWHENDGASPPSFTEHFLSNGASGTPTLFLADVDSDGSTDLLVTSNNGVQWFDNDGAGNFTVHGISTVPEQSVYAFASDMDGDGDIDVVSSDPNNGTIRIYENDGAKTPSFTTRIVASTLSRAVSAADVDGDGDTDILSSETDAVQWYENNGATPPSFIPHDLFPGVGSARRIIGADLDDDGDTDLISTHSFPSQNDSFVWLENDGANPPTFTNHLITDQGMFITTSIVAEDMDDDGDVDLLTGTGEGTRKVSWHRSDFIPEGACCIPTGNCLIGTELACAASHGTYQGDGVACEEISCPPAIPADFDFDGDVDLVDFQRFQELFTGQQ